MVCYLMTVKFEFAKTDSGEIVHSRNAEKGQRFTCINSVCNGEMILKKGQVRVSHFAHKNAEFDHAEETALHYNTKVLLYDFLQNAVLNNEPVFVQFECHCSKIHSINILENIKSVYLEKQVSDVYRPDLSLYCENKFMLAIEVVVTHDLEKEALSYLEKHNVPYLKLITTPKLYSELLDKYFSKNPNLLSLSECVEFFGISILDYCKNNIPVTYYPKLNNIFPCFGYENISEDVKSNGFFCVDSYSFEHDFRGKIENKSLPCDTCKYMHSKPINNVIICKNPLAKKNVFCEWDYHLTPTIFKFDKYFKSGKRHRMDGDYKQTIEQINKLSNSMEFFEYQIFPYSLSDEGGKYMRVYKNGEWVEPNDIEIIMKDTIFCYGKHAWKTVEEVYNTDRQYLYWFLKNGSKGIYSKDILDTLMKMKQEKYL